MTDRLQAHIDEFRTHDGKLGGDFEGSPTLLLHHRGARSGIERVCPLGYQSVDGGYAVFGTNWGKPEHPAWYFNVQANPETTIEVGAEVVSVKARVARGENGTGSGLGRPSSFPLWATMGDEPVAGSPS